MSSLNGNARAVIVDGSRTPFLRAFTEFTEMDAVDLGVAAVRGLLEKTGLSPSEVESIVWGGVVLPSAAPNVGREIALDLGLPHSTEAMTVTRACASGLQAITCAAAAIERGDADVVIAGGGDSTSNVELKLPPKVIRTMGPVMMGKKSSASDYFSAMTKLWPPSSILPRRPEIAERSTGQVMGECAEDMGRRNGISRDAQDAFAVRSHHRAASAADILRDEIGAVNTGNGGSVDQDAIVRGDTSTEKLAKLRPAFAKDGSVTAGNSSALTDGAAAVLLMSEEKARSLGLKPLAAIRNWAYVGVDPADQLLMGPALAMPRVLERCGMELSDIDLVDMHEAFAAQVLSVLSMLESTEFARERLSRNQAVGEVDPERLNIYGGSLALGHPFGATGARMVTTMARELGRGDRQTALLGICAAGGLGAAAVLEAI